VEIPASSRRHGVAPQGTVYSGVRSRMAETPINPEGKLVPRPNGRGALKQGGVHKRSGRLTKDMTELLEAKQRKALELLIEALDVLHSIAQDPEAKAEQRISAIAELRENAERRNGKASLELNDNRTFARVEQRIYVPPLGVEIPEP
jgi:hypothetical protein